jgi:hypothetical protein
MRDWFSRGARALCAGALTLLFSARLLAQSVSSSLGGKVTDALGVAVPGVVVAAITEQGRVKVAVTDDQGRYAFRGLPPGKYTIWAGGDGFSLYENRSLHLLAGRARALDICLRPNSESSRLVMVEIAGVVSLAPPLRAARKREFSPGARLESQLTKEGVGI